MKTTVTHTAQPFQNFFTYLLLFLTAFILSSCESRTVIVNSLDEKDANEILVFLSNKGIDATKVEAKADSGGGSKVVLWNISVEGTRSNEAMALLNQAGLPRRRSQNLLTIFSNSSLVPSGMQEKIRFQAGLAEQIASTIRKIDGILDADVQISYPDEDPLNPNAPKQKVTASVYVKHSGVLDDPNAHLVTRIKRLVAASINNLDYDNVTVIGDKARYGDATLSNIQGGTEDGHTFVNVWSLTLAQDSLSRFRAIFFTFILLILSLLAMLGWTVWKIYPLLNDVGGIRKFFSLTPLQFKQKEIPSEIEENLVDEEQNDETSQNDENS